MPCFSTGIPVISDAIVGSRNAGFTAVADHVTAPFLINRLRVGIAPFFRESWPNPSRTKRMTCSVGAVGAGAGVDTVATAASLERTSARTQRDTANIRIDHTRSRLINVCTDRFFQFYSKRTCTLSWRFPPRQAGRDLTHTSHQDSCGWDSSWRESRWQCYYAY